MAATTNQTPAPGLRRNAVGLREVLFQSITDMAPGAAIAAIAAIAASIPAGAALAVFLVIHAGSNNTLSVFGTSYTPNGFRGLSGVVAGSVYTVLAFGGFEGAPPLAKEARDPGRTVQRAVLGATLGIGVLYLFTTYAADVAFGPAKFAGFSGAGPASWVGMARALYGAFWFFVFLAIVNSTIANANAGVNVSSRTAFAMGRIRAFPHFLAQVHHKHRSPVAAILTGTAVTIAVTLGLGLGYGPEVAFAMTGTAIVIVLAAIYIVVDAACIGFFAKRRHNWNPLLHLVIPVLGIATSVPAWLTAAGIHAFSFVAPLAPPVSYMGPGVAGWMVVGAVYLAYLYARDPQRVTDVGLVHLDGLVTEPGPVPASEGEPA